MHQDAHVGRFVDGMRELGHVENETVRYEARFADGDVTRLPVLARELAALKPDLIVTAGNHGIVAAREAAPGIPIVIATSIDPVGSGFARSLARPAGMITGLSNLTGEVSVKHIELLSAIVPRLSRVAVLTNPANSAHESVVRSLRAAAAQARVELFVASAATTEQLDQAFAEMASRKAGAVIVVVDSLFTHQAARIAKLAARARLPSMDSSGVLADAGGLAGYGQDFGENFYRAATYADKILKGARPGDLPIEQPSKFTLVVNLKTAVAIGVTIPPSILLRADRVIE